MNRIEKIVQKIIAEVKTKGDSAVVKYTKKFDVITIKPEQFVVSPQEIRFAYKKVSPQSLSALKKAQQNIFRYHRHQLLLFNKKKSFRRTGLEIKERLIPLQKIGIYVPGGRFAYPSTVLMSAIPAKIAGVKEVVMVTPIKNLTPEVIVAASLSKVDKIFRIGGVQAIAALAYGTKSIPKVDKIVGPGNIYVTTAKKMLYGEVGIDLLAGPSEIVILADNTANPEFVLSDLLAQTEHDSHATASLLTIDKKMLKWIKSNIPQNFCSQIELIGLRDINEGIRIANQKSPEHLELILKNPEPVIAKICNAGTICVGNYTPVASSDYIAGPSHILPTGRTARFSSGVSVNDFLKKSAIIKYTKAGLINDLKEAVTLAGIEGLKYHQNSLTIRK